MSRRKPIKIDFNGKKRKIAKDNERKYYIGTWIFGILLIGAIVLGGVYQENDVIAGVALIVIGLLCLLEICFICYAERNEWYSYKVYWYDYLDGMPTVYPKEKRENDLKEYKISIYIIVAVLFCLAIGAVIGGILKIVG